MAPEEPLQEPVEKPKVEEEEPSRLPKLKLVKPVLNHSASHKLLTENSGLRLIVTARSKLAAPAESTVNQASKQLKIPIFARKLHRDDPVLVRPRADEMRELKQWGESLKV
jgi:hypothetical protein